MLAARRLLFSERRLADRFTSLLRHWRLKPSRRPHTPGRNRARLCEGRDGPVLVKLADPGLSLRTEAEALDACEGATHFSVPRCLFRSADGDALGIEWIPHAPTLWNLRHQRKYPKALARRLGEAIAELHAGALPIPRVQSSFDFGSDLLWPTPDEYARSNPASLELLARVQQDPTAPGVLEWLSSRAHFADLARPLHGDLRQPNVLEIGRAHV